METKITSLPRALPRGAGRQPSARQASAQHACMRTLAIRTTTLMGEGFEGVRLSIATKAAHQFAQGMTIGGLLMRCGSGGGAGRQGRTRQERGGLSPIAPALHGIPRHPITAADGQLCSPIAQSASRACKPAAMRRAMLSQESILPLLCRAAQSRTLPTAATRPAAALPRRRPRAKPLSVGLGQWHCSPAVQVTHC